MTGATGPFLLLSVLVDSSARPAALTQSHGDALERALMAAGSQAFAGLDIVELPLGGKAFSALKAHLQLGAEAVGLYDLFPVAAAVDARLRRVAGQFLAAEALWALEEAGALGGVPLNLRLDLPEGWDRDPSALRDRLVQAGTLELSPDAVASFRSIKAAWDVSHPPAALRSPEPAAPSSEPPSEQPPPPVQAADSAVGIAADRAQVGAASEDFKP